MPDVFHPQDAIDYATALVQERYGQAAFAIAAGSIVRGCGTIGSDLDLVVMFTKLDAAYRESFTFRQMPVEAFVHDYETIQAFMDDDYKDSHAAMLHMIATGVVVPASTPDSAKLKKYAADLLERGAPAMDTAKSETLRYMVSDLIDDLRGHRTPAEQRAIMYHLYNKIGELALRQKELFFAPGKYMARDMQAHCPDIFATLEKIMGAAHGQGIESNHVKELENIINSIGGFLFDGYMQKAPADKRSPPVWLTVNAQ